MKKVALTLSVFSAAALSVSVRADTAALQARYNALLTSSAAIAQQIAPNLHLQLQATQMQASAAQTPFIIRPSSASVPSTGQIVTTFTPDAATDLGSATSKITAAAAELQKLGLNAGSAQISSNALSYLTVKSTFLPDDELKQSWIIAPFHLYARDKTADIHYDGLQLNATFAQSDIEKGFFNASGDFHSGKFSSTLTENQQSLTVTPFDGKFTTRANGSIDAETTPITAASTNHGQSATLRANRVTLTGQQLQYDPAIHYFLGDVTLSAHDATLSSSHLAKPIELSSLSFRQKNAKNGHFYNSSLSYAMTPVTDIPALFGFAGIKVQDANFTLQGEHFSEAALRAFNALKASDNAPNAATINTLINALNASHAQILTQLRLATIQGTATLDMLFHVKNLSRNNSVAWQRAIAQKNGKQLLHLLVQHADVNGKLILPKAIVNTTGYGALVKTLGKNFLEDKNDHYEATIMTQNNTLYLNGSPIFKADSQP